MPFTQYDPVVHAEQPVAPAFEYFPVEQTVAAVRPAVAQNEPAVHEVQDVCPVNG
jgi:hypothetical protein